MDNRSQDARSSIASAHGTQQPRCNASASSSAQCSLDREEERFANCTKFQTGLQMLCGCMVHPRRALL